MFKKLNIVLGLIISISIVIGVVISLDNRWAKAERLVMVEQRLEQKINKDRADTLQERIWKLEDRHGNNMPTTVKEEYRRLEKEMDGIIKQLEKEKKEK